MTYNPLIASVTIALVAIASLAAIIYQVINGHDADTQLVGILGLTLGAFLRMPGSADIVQIRQSADKPVPVDVADAGYGLVQWLCIIALVLAIVFLGVQLFDVNFRG